uniref:Uncharacterized protein n=1 Tax=Chromera velia CCMP2878 TaxID=1169474 RepID=A0A0G4I9E7_9ALVE|eukprot:Cvel_12244.t1-p1 / transcript=Cvel_12244.t1 / gene=Cvel_12244 / organism=Chromera_velia_CCMP2878 / gene_product=hypothetical protein / transcript_product=hypothetical protein / location=Cvel_scaffold793:11385-12464(-) / protein_length=360 / sequence_SO=supercontig / SO=protein_coding / is_pseudo=false
MQLDETTGAGARVTQALIPADREAKVVTRRFLRSLNVSGYPPAAGSGRFRAGAHALFLPTSCVQPVGRKGTGRGGCFGDRVRVTHTASRLDVPPWARDAFLCDAAAVNAWRRRGALGATRNDQKSARVKGSLTRTTPPSTPTSRAPLQSPSSAHVNSSHKETDSHLSTPPTGTNIGRATLMTSPHKETDSHPSAPEDDPTEEGEGPVEPLSFRQSASLGSPTLKPPAMEQGQQQEKGSLSFARASPLLLSDRGCSLLELPPYGRASRESSLGGMLVGLSSPATPLLLPASRHSRREGGRVGSGQGLLKGRQRGAANAARQVFARKVLREHSGLCAACTELRPSARPSLQRGLCASILSES